MFFKTLDEYAKAVASLGNSVRNGGASHVLSGLDARDFASEWKARSLPQIDLGVTSPPYIKTIDIIYNQMAEYFWIGDLFGLENQQRQNLAKQRYIGTEKVFASAYQEVGELGIAEIDSLVEKIRRTNQKNGYIVYRYFSDMLLHFKQMGQVINHGGIYVVVVGDSTIADMLIPTHQLLSKCAEKAGFASVSSFAYEIRNRYMRFPRMGRGGIVDLDWVTTYQFSA